MPDVDILGISCERREGTRLWSGRLAVEAEMQSHLRQKLPAGDLRLQHRAGKLVLRVKSDADLTQSVH